MLFEVEAVLLRESILHWLGIGRLKGIEWFSRS